MPQTVSFSFAHQMRAAPCARFRWAGTRGWRLCTLFTNVYLFADSPTLDVIYLVCEAMQLILLFMAMWGLMILFFASRGLLKGFNPDLKIIALKVVIIIGSLQNIIVPVVVAQVYGGNETCAPVTCVMPSSPVLFPVPRCFALLSRNRQHPFRADWCRSATAEKAKTKCLTPPTSPQRGKTGWFAWRRHPWLTLC